MNRFVEIVYNSPETCKAFPVCGIGLITEYIKNTRNNETFFFLFTTSRLSAHVFIEKK